jgi:predicted outer membrane repeat protein
MRFIPFFLFYAICLNAQQTYYVAQNATGLNTGDSWQHAFTNLHDGLEIANHGDTVLVAIGAYLPDNTGDRSRHFLLKNGVRLFGGFLGTETLFSERNPDLNKPILSGNIGDLLDSTDNSFTIMVMMTPDSTTIIDGLHFTGGHASATNPVSNTSAEVCGGAIYIFGGNSTVMPSFRHCRFENNYAKRDGGAIYLFQPFERISSPIFTNCLFLRNSAGKDGGALHVVYCDSIGQTIRFEKCNFIQNQSMGLGGSGVLVLKGKLYLDLNRDTFISNIGKTNAGCLYIIVREKDSLSIRLDSCLVKNNTGSTIQTFAVTSLNTEYQLPSIKITNSKFDQNFGTLTSQYPVLLTSIICNSPTNNYLLSNCQIDMTSDFQGGIFDQPSDTFNVVGNDYFGFGLVHNIISFPTKYLSLSKNRMECNCFGFGSDGLATENIISGFSDYLNPATNLYEPLIRSGHFQNNLFINNKLRYNYSNPTNASDYSTFTNNVFINNRNNNGTLGIPVQAPLVQSPDYFRNNAVDITCNNLPAYLGCVYNNFYSDPGQIDFFTYKPIECSKLINKGLNLPTISATDFDNNPRIIDGQGV